MPAHKVSADTSVLYEMPTPKMSQVLMLNDHYTTMDFVVSMLREFFDKPLEEAQTIMLSIHHEGEGVCGVYPYDIAEYKAQCVRDRARALNFPLQLVVEEVK
nr:ATP-dependent Clp protease adaptor ClpS [Helicobacter cetorum]